MMTFRPFQYINPDHPEKAVPSILQALSAGAKWVQFRLKAIDDMNFIQLALEAKILCESYKADFIINDRVHLLDEINPQGIHLGLEDTPISKVKAKYGTQFYYGGTANTLEDVKYQYQQGADYIGFGPFQTTQTKKKLSPLVGSKGYQNLKLEMDRNYIKIPVLAIGGIQLSDLKELKKSGVDGIAVSSGFHHNEKEFVKTVNDLWKIS